MVQVVEGKGKHANTEKEVMSLRIITIQSSGPGFTCVQIFPPESFEPSVRIFSCRRPRKGKGKKRRLALRNVMEKISSIANTLSNAFI